MTHNYKDSHVPVVHLQSRWLSETKQHKYDLRALLDNTPAQHPYTLVYIIMHLCFLGEKEEDVLLV